MIKSLDTKIADILANPSGSKAFIIADAKDADMAFGVAAPGPRHAEKANDYESDWKTLEDFRSQIRDVVRQGIVDIMLLSASNVEVLAMKERLFENSAVTPAARANEPVRPPASNQVLLAGFLCRELRLELAQVLGERRSGQGPTLPVGAC